MVFAVLEILPGNAAQVLMGPDADPEAVAAMAEQLGLNQPALQRYMPMDGRFFTGRSGQQLCLRLTRVGAGARAPGADTAAGRAGHGPDHGAGLGWRGCMPPRATTSWAISA